MASPSATRRQNIAQIARARRQVEQARRRPSLPSRPGRRPAPNPGLHQRLRAKRGKQQTSSGPLEALSSAITKASSAAGKQASRAPGKKPMAGGLAAGIGLGAAALLKRRRSTQDEVTVTPAPVAPAVVTDPVAGNE